LAKKPSDEQRQTPPPDDVPAGPSDQLKATIEALIFASPDPISLKTLSKLLDSEPKEDVKAALEQVRASYDRPGGLQLVEVAGAIRSSRGPSCTNGYGGCFTSGPRRSCRWPPWRHWP